MRAASVFAVVLVGCNALTGVADLEVNGDDATVDGGPVGRDASSDSVVPPAPPPPPPSDASTDGKISDSGVDGPRGDSGFPLIVFVTSTTTTGNFGTPQQADAICTDLAGKAGLPGTYVAWVSSGSSNAIDRLTTTGPWYTLDGMMAVSSNVELQGSTITRAINVTEQVTSPSGDLHAWTATSHGTFSGQTCVGWTSSSNNNPGTAGSVGATSASWTAAGLYGCGLSLHFYCFQN